MTNDEHILLLRSFDHELSDHEHVQLDRLLAKSSTARNVKEREVAFRALVSATRVASFGASFVSDVVSATVDSNTESYTRTRLQSPLRLLTIPRQFRAIAAILLLAALLGAYALFMLPDDLQRELAAPIGTTIEHSLPDGSTVILNAGSRIKYADDFTNIRSVELEGEAHFDIVHSSATFTVLTREASLTVYGTSFNVRAWSKLEKRTVVTLHSGSLEVEDRSSGDSRFLDPGDRVIVGLGETLPATMQDPGAINTRSSWTNGGLSFQSETLAYATAELERMYGVKIRIPDGTLADRRVTYLERAPSSIDTVLTTLCHALSAEYRLINDGYEITTTN